MKCRKKVNANENENEKSIREKMEAEANGEQMERVADGTREFIRCLFRLQTTFLERNFNLRTQVTPAPSIRNQSRSSKVSRIVFG